MRLLGVLALVAPVMVGILFLSNPELTASWVDDGSRSIVAAVTALTIGVAMTSLIAWTIVRIRYGRLVKAAERIAAGDYSVTVSEAGGGLETRLGAAINVISASLADTYDRATVDRLTGVANRQALLAELFSEVERAARYERPLCVAFVDIDHFKAVNDSYGHEAGDVVLRGVAQTIAENLRASDYVGRYGGEEFMLILTETTVEEAAGAQREAAQARRADALSRSRATPTCRSRSRSGSPAGPASRSAWSTSSATPMRRCTRPSRSAATRPTSSRSPTRTPACRGPRSRRPGVLVPWRSAGERARPRPTC